MKIVQILSLLGLLVLLHEIPPSATSVLERRCDPSHWSTAICAEICTHIRLCHRDSSTVVNHFNHLVEILEADQHELDIDLNLSDPNNVTNMCQLRNEMEAYWVILKQTHDYLLEQKGTNSTTRHLYFLMGYVRSFRNTLRLLLPNPTENVGEPEDVTSPLSKNDAYNFMRIASLKLNGLTSKWGDWYCGGDQCS